MSRLNAETEVPRQFAKDLNSHGHGFHHAVIRRAKALNEHGRSGLRVDGIEFPVMNRGQVTHIDFVMQSRSCETFFVAECKRSDPARSRWCFLRTPTLSNDPTAYSIGFESIIFQPVMFKGPRFMRVIRPQMVMNPVCNLGLTVKVRGVTGDGEGQSKTSAIDAAVTQVLRGTSGLIRHICTKSLRDCSTARQHHFVPIIFTTAELWVSDNDISTADIQTGDLDIQSFTAHRVPWLWFKHNRSASLSPELEFDPTFQESPNISLRSELNLDYSLSVAIVGPSGIDDFLGQSLWSTW